MLSPLQVTPTEIPYPTLPCLCEGAHPLTHPLLSFLTGIHLHWGIKHPQAQGPLLSLMTKQGHPLPHMCPGPWVTPCVLFGWWVSPQELQGIWRVHTVAPSSGLQTPSVAVQLPERDQYRGKSSHPTIGLSMGSPMGELGTGPPLCSVTRKALHSPPFLPLKAEFIHPCPLSPEKSYP